MAEEGQQHPIKIYLWIWLLLFVVSFFSYMVDYLQFQGALRWTLILVFMFVKAGFIVAIFMHMQWERLALKLAILGPPVAILVLIWLMSYEGFYIEDSRVEYYGESTMEPQTPAHH
ncbi:MAG: cytochrome C oxidase subunit IV family protein [Gammaproteobacteria bacterium]|nr:cytochrome C oxidase subunit IV family protein [Gammaproteobacteria bacterium]MDH3363085.1 cytochrome C oxidase subunit IV family protein [Gammaproteobacteria bacterium]MDH3480124.1 cytochrome C oxidase subunit IV family protein [Gammaproteobacteria bacterium]